MADKKRMFNTFDNFIYENVTMCKNNTNNSQTKVDKRNCTKINPPPWMSQFHSYNVLRVLQSFSDTGTSLTIYHRDYI